MLSVLSTDDVEPRSRRDYWRSVLTDSIVPFDSWFDGDAFTRPRARGARITKGLAGAVGIVDIAGPEGEVRRTPGLIRRSDPGVFNLYVQRAGRSVVEQAGRQAVLGPGDCVLLDLCRPTHWVAQGRQGINLVMFPRSLLSPHAGRALDLTAVTLPGRERIGALLGSVARQLVELLIDDTTAGDIGLATAMVDLIGAALTARSGGTVPPAELGPGTQLLRIKAYVDRRLGDPGLSVAEVAAAHHMSVRTLQKLFQDAGGTVSGWIRDRRLERCRRDLLDPALRHRTVAAIGARWGFVDATHFGRVFRARYALTPGQYRMAAQAS